MSEPARKIAVPPAEPSTALERLLSDRAGLGGELERLSATHARLRAAALTEAAVLQEIGDLGKAEIAATVAWATAGGAGDPPVPDTDKRRTLAAKLATAQAAAVAATGSLPDLDHQIRGLTERLTDLEKAIELAAFDVAEREFRELVKQHAALMAEGGKLAARIHGMRACVSNHGRSLIDRGDAASGRQYLSRSEAMGSIKLALPSFNQHEQFAAAESWSRRIMALRKGA